MRKHVLMIAFLLVLASIAACTAPPPGEVAETQVPALQTAGSLRTEEPTATPEPTPELTVEPTPTPTPRPTPVPVLTTPFGQELVPMSEDLSAILVYVVKGTLNGKAVTLFLTEGGTEYMGKSWYCVFNDAWTGKRLLCRQSGSGVLFNAAKTKGDILPLEYLPGDFSSDNRILKLPDYLKSEKGYDDEKMMVLVASGEVATYQNMLDFYKANIPEVEWYIAPSAEMRAINNTTYVEKFLIDGAEKLMIVEHGSWKIQGKTRLYSRDLISGKMLYDSDNPGSDLLKPQTPPDVVPITEFFIGMELGRAVTIEELLEFYQEQVSAEKQYILQ